ncbi:MAG: hypothetical protein O3B47_05195, partial [bacterium]|nr:hypothetical protein [bacterium]
MFKKFISFLSAVSLLAMLVPQVAFAVDNDTVVTGVTLTVALPATPATFDPNNSADPLVIDVELGTEFWDTELKTSKGHVKVLKGTTVIKTVTSWGVALPEAVPDLSSLEWDGKALDDTPEAKAICVDADTVCKSGTDYKIEVSVEFDKGGTTISDVDTADFNILPKVSVSNLAVSEPTFNPLTQTADISFKTSATGLISVEVLDGDTVKRTILDKKQLSAGTYTKTEEAGLAWDGKDGNGILLPSKPYTIRTTSSTLEGSDPDTDTVTVTVEIPQTVKIDAFSVTTTSGDSNFDPAKPASESLFISYTLSQAADSVSVDVKDANNVLIKSFSSSNATDTFSDWTGKFSNKFVLPGVYTVKISAAKSGETTVTDTKTFTVLYGAAEKGDILPALLTPIPSSFDPDVE